MIAYIGLIVNGCALVFHPRVGGKYMLILAYTNAQMGCNTPALQHQQSNNDRDKQVAGMGGKRAARFTSLDRHTISSKVNPGCALAGGPSTQP